MSEMKIAIILGTTRPGRVGHQVAQWVADHAAERASASYEVIDLERVGLPLLDEALPAAYGAYANQHTKDWADTVARYDGYVFVTPEYNRSIPAALKNAIDFVYAEWNDKAAGIVSYGGITGGARAAEHLRTIFGELQIAHVRQQVLLSTVTDFENYTVFTPAERHLDSLSTLLDQVETWAGALQPLRASA